LLRQRPAADFDPMIQPSATLATVLPSTVDVFDFHGFFSYYLTSLTLRSGFLRLAIRYLLIPIRQKTTRLIGLQISCHACGPTIEADSRQRGPDSVSKQDVPV
jgi:hypothetical protein